MREAKRALLVCLFLLAGLVAGGNLHLRAQSSDAPEAKRKVRVMGRPVYSDLARKLNLTGVVRVEVTIGPDGRVKRTHVLGGHPVLAIDAEKAAQQTEFEPGPKETIEVIEFKFTP